MTKEDVEKIGAEVKALKASGKKKGDAELDAAIAKLLEAKAAASAPKIVGGLPRKPAVSAEGNTGSGGGGGEVVDYAHDFFSKRAYLTVSGQMNVETFCCALSRAHRCRQLALCHAQRSDARWRDGCCRKRWQTGFSRFGHRSGTTSRRSSTSCRLTSR